MMKKYLGLIMPNVIIFVVGIIFILLSSYYTEGVRNQLNMLFVSLTFITDWLTNLVLYFTDKKNLKLFDCLLTSVIVSVCHLAVIFIVKA